MLVLSPSKHVLSEAERGEREGKRRAPVKKPFVLSLSKHPWLSPLAFLALPLLLLAGGCVASAEPGDPALPPGFEAAGVPDVDLNAYAYVDAGVPVTLPASALGDGAGPISLLRVEAALRDPGVDQAAWLLTLDGEARFLSATETPWSDGIAAAWGDGQRACVEARYPEAWETIRLLPAHPPGKAVAVGFVRNAGDLADDVLALQGIQVPGLGSALGFIRVRTLAFAAYANDLASLPAALTPEAIQDAGVGIVAVGRAGYPGVLVNFLIGRFASRLGLDDVTVVGEEARHRSLDGGLHLMMKSYGATLYFVVAGTRDSAEALLGSVVADQS